MAADLTTALVSAVVVGAGFGFQGSVSPGPLQTLIISESLTNGFRSSWRAAFAPILTDPIALILAICVVANVPNGVVAAIAFVGAALLTRIAWGGFKTKEADFQLEQKTRLSLGTIWAVNMMNPNLWVYAFTVGALNVCNYAKTGGIATAAAYLGAFFLTICACNLATAYLASSLKSLFNVRWLVWFNRALSVFLVVVALTFVKIGVEKLGFEF